MVGPERQNGAKQGNEMVQRLHPVSRFFCGARSKKMPQRSLLSSLVLAEALAPRAHRCGQAQVRLYTDIQRCLFLPEHLNTTSENR